MTRGATAKAAILTTTAGVLALAVLLGGCAELRGAAPGCEAPERLAIVAQSLPGAAYVPCLEELRPGWSASGFEARSGGTRFSLTSDRDPRHPVRVGLQAGCDVGDATTTTPRADGARTFLLLRSITPRYAGTLFDVFPGGCVTYQFDFARGPHIALIDDFEHQVQLVARREVALALRRTYEAELQP